MNVSCLLSCLCTLYLSSLSLSRRLNIVSLSYFLSWKKGIVNSCIFSSEVQSRLSALNYFVLSAVWRIQNVEKNEIIQWLKSRCFKVRQSFHSHLFLFCWTEEHRVSHCIRPKYLQKMPTSVLSHVCSEWLVAEKFFPKHCNTPLLRAVTAALIKDSKNILLLIIYLTVTLAFPVTITIWWIFSENTVFK